MNLSRVLVVGALLFTGPVAWSLQEGVPDFRITQAGPALDPDYDAFNPAVAYNSVDQEFLLVWVGDGGDALGPQEDEIYGQRIRADNGQRVGSSGFRISQMGPDGDLAYQALDPAVTYNSIANEFLVVWWGDTNTGALVEDEREIWGRRLAGDGMPLAAQFRISFMGTDGDDLAEGISPAVIYSPTENEYFVVWGGDNIGGVFVNQDFEIWGQRIGASDDALIGSVVRISDMGEEEGNPSFTAADPNLTYNPVTNEYFVTWEGDDDGGTAVNGEDEVYGQRIDAATGAEMGPNDIRVSFLGPDGDTGYDSTNAAVTYNPISGRYLVVFQGSDDQGGSVRNDMEIHTQQIASDGTLTGAVQRISSMGPDGVTTYWGLNPAVAVSASTGEFLVTWRGESDEGELVNNEWEIYGRRLTSDAQLDGPTARLSRMGPDGSRFWNAGLPGVAYDSAAERFLVVWNGDDERPDLAPDEFEVFGQFANLDIIFSAGFE